MARKILESRLKAPLGQSVKWWARYHRDNPSTPVKIKNPMKFLSAHQRRKLLLIASPTSAS